MRTFCERLLALVFALSVVCVAVNAARADAYEDALAHFLADSFDDTIEGVNAVAASGHPLAEKVLGALQLRRLMFSAAQKRVFFKDDADNLFDAASGSPASSAPSDLEQVRLNNRVRNIIAAILGNLTLLSPDPNKRFDAAQAVFKSRDANALPALEQAIAKETVARVKRALSEARAAIILYTETSAESDKIDAIALIRDRGNDEALALLRGLPTSTPPAVKQLAADAIAGIERSMAAWETVRNAWFGAAARRHRPRDHVRRDGRHQHGARRDGHAGRLYNVRRSTNHAGVLSRSRPARLLADHRRSACLPDNGLFWSLDRARHHPIPLWASTRHAACDLGPLAGPAAGCAHRVWPDQQGRQQPVLDERLVRFRSHCDYLQSPLDRPVHPHRLRAAARALALYPARA